MSSSEDETGIKLIIIIIIIMLEALSREFREGLIMELLYNSGDLVLIDETKKLLVKKVREWKERMKRRV